MPYRQVLTIATGFQSTLRGIALDRQGRLHAAGDAEVRVFDGAGAVARKWVAARPVLSVAVAPDGAVFAGQLRQIQVFDGAGKTLRTCTDAVLVGGITAIGFLKDGVLAGDAGGRCIRRFDAAGKFANDIGKDNPLNGLHIPNGVVDFGVDSQGIIHVANPGKHRVERYSPEGKLLGHMGRFTGPDPSGFSGCCNPTNVAVAGSGLLCVTEKAGPRAKVYDYSGKLIAAIDSADFDPNAKNMDVVVDPRGRIYVAEPVTRKVLVFES